MLVAGELRIIVPDIDLESVAEFINYTRDEYEQSTFFLEDNVYFKRNNRHYPWNRRVLEFKGVKFFNYDKQPPFDTVMPIVDSLPVTEKTVILLYQESQDGYDFNFHFDAELDYGFRICFGLDTTKTFLELGQLKDEYIEHARQRKKINNDMVTDRIYKLDPLRSNTVLCLNATHYPHRVPINSNQPRAVLIVKGNNTNLSQLDFLQRIDSF